MVSPGRVAGTEVALSVRSVPCHRCPSSVPLVGRPLAVLEEGHKYFSFKGSLELVSLEFCAVICFCANGSARILTVINIFMKVL